MSAAAGDARVGDGGGQAPAKRVYSMRVHGVPATYAECLNCGGGIYRYQGENGWQHINGRFMCHPVTSAMPKPGTSDDEQAAASSTEEDGDG